MEKPVESITKHHFNRGGKQSSVGAKKSATFRSQPNSKPVNSANNMVHCSNLRYDLSQEPIPGLSSNLLQM